MYSIVDKKTLNFVKKILTFFLPSHFYVTFDFHSVSILKIQYMYSIWKFRSCQQYEFLKGWIAVKYIFLSFQKHTVKINITHISSWKLTILCLLFIFSKIFKALVEFWKKAHPKESRKPISKSRRLCYLHLFVHLILHGILSFSWNDINMFTIKCLDSSEIV